MNKTYIPFLIILLTSTLTSTRESTVRLPADPLQVMESQIQEAQKDQQTERSEPRETRFPKAGILSTTYDSLQVEVMLRPGEWQAVYVDVEAGTLGYTPPEPIVPASAVPYIQSAPESMQRQLYLNLSELEPFVLEGYLAMLDDANPLWRDELYYCLAHLGHQILMDWYRIDLLLENVREMYHVDSLLEYVEIIDMGTPGTPSHYTVTQYVTTDTFLTGHDTVAIDPEIYYRYVMFPKITDEMPDYIDPETGEVDATHGKFWRTWFWDVAETTETHSCWALGDSFMAYSTLWNGLRNNTTENGAIGLNSQWIGNCLDFDSDDERPIQPVRIYAKHMGRCGEHSDMRTAVSRVGLIPARNVESISTDHVWNEFYTGYRWAHLDGGDVDNPWVYVDGWGKQFATVYEHTGDSRMILITERYSRTLATLELAVYDGIGKPVDGAKIMIAADYSDAIVYDCILYTDCFGKAYGKVGANKHLYWRVDSEIGSNPEPGYVSNMVTNTVDGEHYTRTMYLSRYIDWMDWFPGDTTTAPSAYLQASIIPLGEFIKYSGAFQAFEVTYYEFREAAKGFEIFVLTDEEYSRFVSDSSFHALAMQENVASAFPGVPLDNEPHWLVAGNIANVENTLVGELTVAIKDSATGMAEVHLPDEMEIVAYPNPFNSALYIKIAGVGIDYNLSLQVEIFDINGRVVNWWTSGLVGLVDGPGSPDPRITQSPGHRITGSPFFTWSPEQTTPSGIYFIKAKMGTQTAVKKVIYLK